MQNFKGLGIEGPEQPQRRGPRYFAESQETIKEAKKKKEKGTTYKGEHYKYNPWAVCHKSVGPDKDVPAFERCFQHVKDKSKNKKNKTKKSFNLKDYKTAMGYDEDVQENGILDGSWLDFIKKIINPAGSQVPQNLELAKQKLFRDYNEVKVSDTVLQDVLDVLDKVASSTNDKTATTNADEIKKKAEHDVGSLYRNFLIQVDAAETTQELDRIITTAGQEAYELGDFYNRLVDTVNSKRELMLKNQNGMPLNTASSEMVQPILRSLPYSSESANAQGVLGDTQRGIITKKKRRKSVIERQDIKDSAKALEIDG